MNISLISLHCPTATNFKGASALPYHLIKFAPESYKVKNIWTYNLNEVPNEKIRVIERDLSVKVHILPIPRWYTWLFKLHISPLKILLKYPLLSYFKLSKSQIESIVSDNPEGIWIYGEDIGMSAYDFPELPIVVTTPDSTSLFYNRMIGKNSEFHSWPKLVKYLILGKKYISLVERFRINNTVYHTVGKEDKDYLIEINPQLNTTFILHPHYDCIANPEIDFSAEKLQILIAGRNDFYMRDGAAEMINMFLSNKELSDYYSVTFLGKGWESNVEPLRKEGYDCNHITYVEDYITKISQFDIQITPIDVGVGTKGKVLDAFANGLLVIGKKRALENIQAADNEDCYEYSNAEELHKILTTISQNIKKSEEIAKNGMAKVRMRHNRERVSKNFFKLFSI